LGPLFGKVFEGLSLGWGPKLGLFGGRAQEGSQKGVKNGQKGGPKPQKRSKMAIFEIFTLSSIMFFGFLTIFGPISRETVDRSYTGTSNYRK
jgi:hypothetical protein